MLCEGSRQSGFLTPADRACGVLSMHSPNQLRKSRARPNQSHWSFCLPIQSNFIRPTYLFSRAWSFWLNMLKPNDYDVFYIKNQEELFYYWLVFGKPSFLSYCGTWSYLDFFKVLCGSPSALGFWASRRYPWFSSLQLRFRSSTRAQG